MNPRGLQAFGKTRANSNNRLCAPLPGVGKGLPARTIHEERKSRAHCHFERSEKSAFWPALIGRKPSRARKRTPAVELPTRPLRCFGISGAAHHTRAAPSFGVRRDPPLWTAPDRAPKLRITEHSKGLRHHTRCGLRDHGKECARACRATPDFVSPLARQVANARRSPSRPRLSTEPNPET